MTRTTPWSVADLAARITSIDPLGPLPETSHRLSELYVELCAVVGDAAAPERFDDALALALRP
jgi:hypothetical protein